MERQKGLLASVSAGRMNLTFITEPCHGSVAPQSLVTFNPNCLGASRSLPAITGDVELGHRNPVSSSYWRD